MAQQVAEVSDYLLRNTNADDVIVVLDRDDASCVVVTEKEWRGKVRLDIREYWQPPEFSRDPKYQDNPDGHYTPTKKGTTIPLDQIEKFIEALVAWQETRMPGSIIVDTSGHDDPLEYVPGELGKGEGGGT